MGGQTSGRDSHKNGTFPRNRGSRDQIVPKWHPHDRRGGDSDPCRAATTSSLRSACDRSLILCPTINFNEDYVIVHKRAVNKAAPALHA